MEETKTAEETTILDLAIQEIEKQKFNLNVHKLPATKVGLTDALNVLEYLKEEHYIKCECGHIVEHKFSHTNEDGQVTCSKCVITQQQSANAELKKQNEELANLLKDTFNFPKDDLIEWANGSKMITITLHPSHFERFNQMFQNTDQQNN